MKAFKAIIIAFALISFTTTACSEQDKSKTEKKLENAADEVRETMSMEDEDLKKELEDEISDLKDKIAQLEKEAEGDRGPFYDEVKNAKKAAEEMSEELEEISETTEEEAEKLRDEIKQFLSERRDEINEAVE